MQQPLATGFPARHTPTFHVIRRERLSPTAILLAIVLAAAALACVLYGLVHNGRSRFLTGKPGATRSSSAGSGDAATDDKDDDPSQIDTIVLGDPADPPAPARSGNHVSPVHPTILVRLPRFGEEVGLIPNTPAGRLLYAWLAAFNQGNLAALSTALPSTAPASTVDAQMLLRQQTGGFTLLSAKEVQPGVVVFRLHDQTLAGTEFLGALQARPNSSPLAIQTFSLGAVGSPAR